MKTQIKQQILAKAGLMVAIALGNVSIAAIATSQSASLELEPVAATSPTAFDAAAGSKSFVPAVLRRNDNPFPYRAVIRGDDRVPMMSREYPWTTIGRVDGVDERGEGYHCTGTLIAETVVLTNAHCVINPETGKVARKMRFMPNLIDGDLDSADVAQVEAYYVGTTFRDRQEASDWALLKINKPLGQKYGYLGWKNLPAATLARTPKKMALVGYSADFPKTAKSFPGLVFKAGPGMTAGVHKGCSILGKQANLLLHDCDTTGGASGGPILSKIGDDYYLVALHAGWRRVNGKVINYAVEIARIEEWVKKNVGK
jgi:protease YdgD